MRRVMWRVLTVFLLMLGLGLPAAAADRVALVIGNGAYAHATELPNPPNDARVVAGALKKIGFDVVEGIDLGHREMQEKLKSFLDRAATARVVLLFYAGHGLQVDGRNYLVPVDAKLTSRSDLNFGTVELDRVLASLDDPVRANIVILDACRDNPLARSFAAKTRSGSVGAGLAAYTSLGTGSLIAFATAPGKVAADGLGKNSPFTQSLVKHVATPGLEVRQMLTRVRNDVAAATGDRQIPWDNSSLRGDVYLAGLSPDTAAHGAPKDRRDKMQSEGGRTDEASTDEKWEIELAYWNTIEASSTSAPFEAYLAKFPDGAFAELAKIKIDELKKRSEREANVKEISPPAPKTESADIEIAFWESIQASSNIAAFEGYLKKYPQGSFALLAKLKIEELRKPKPEPKEPGSTAAKAHKESTSGRTPPAGRRGRLCKDGNMAHCKIACSNGFQKACARLRRGF